MEVKQTCIGRKHFSSTGDDYLPRCSLTTPGALLVVRKLPAPDRL